MEEVVIKNELGIRMVFEFEKILTFDAYYNYIFADSIQDIHDRNVIGISAHDDSGVEGVMKSLC